MGKLLFLPSAGQTAECERCGDVCRVAQSRKVDATMLRASEKPKGFCANCAVTEWLMVADKTHMIPDIIPEHFLVPAVQEQFAKLMATAISDMDPREINWSKVVEHWSLPMPNLDKLPGILKRARRAKPKPRL